MKPFFLLLTLLPLIGFWPAPGADAGVEPLKLGTGEWAPYTSAEMEGEGVAAEIVLRVFHKMGVEVQFVYYPWTRCYDSVKYGAIWGAFPFAYTEERAQSVDFSEPILPSTTRFFYYGKNPKVFHFERLQDLKAFRIGGLKGHFYESIFEKNEIPIDYVKKLENGFEKLMLGRNDLVVANELVGWFTIQNRFQQERKHFKTLKKPLSRHGLRMIVSREFPGAKEILDRFNAALMAVKSEIFYDTLLQKLEFRRGEFPAASTPPPQH